MTLLPDNTRLLLLHELGCAFAACIELDELVAFVVAKCREVLDAEGAAVLLLDHEHNELYFPYVADEDPVAAAQLRQLRFPADRGIAGEVLRSGHGLRVDDAASDPRFYSGVDRRTGMTTRDLLSAPLTTRRGTIGVLQVLNCRTGTAFSDADLAFLEALAGSVAVALDNARLYGQLKAFAAGLEVQVAERTHELREKNLALEETLAQLRLTQDELVAQEKLASLGQLTAGIAHEIKNPLNFVTNFAQLSTGLTQELREEVEAQADRLDPESRDALEAILSDLETNVRKINEHGQRADHIVRDMLQHSRGSRGEPQPTDINRLLAEYLALTYHGLRGQDPAFNVGLDTDYDSAVGMVRAVPQDLCRVFVNLLNNACYAAYEKRRELGEQFSPMVTVRTHDRGDHVEIRIRDNGNGIPAAVRDKIFEPFFTTKPPGQGTGLGLSISYDIIRQHRGELRIDSEEGQYAEFIITLPKHG